MQELTSNPAGRLIASGIDVSGWNVVDKLKEWAGVLTSFGTLIGVLITLGVLVLHTNDKIEAVDQRLSAKLETVDQRLSAELEAVDQRLGAKLETVDQRLSAELEAVDQRLSAKLELAERRLMEELAVIGSILARIDERTARTDDRLAGIETRLVAVEKTTAQLGGKVESLEGSRFQAVPISDWSKIKDLKDLPAGIVWVPAPIPAAAKTEKSE